MAEDQQSAGPEGHALVVLIMPELLVHLDDVAALRAALERKGRRVKALIRVNDQDQLAFAEQFSLTQIETQLLIAQGVGPLSIEIDHAFLPQGGKGNDIDEFAFALADVLLIDATHDEHRHAPRGRESVRRANELLQRARQLGKIVIEPTDPLPPLTPPKSLADDLDPNGGGWRCLADDLDPNGGGWRCLTRDISGRWEQAILELFAFDWFNNQDGGRRRSWRRLRRCFRLKWRPTAYFGPDACRDLSPDPIAMDPASPLVSRFEAMDRAALHGSYIHRDLIWLVHALAATAVLTAVSAVICNDTTVLPIVEVGVLFVIAVLVGGAQHYNLHEHWIACRMAAEQLRIARMCLPLMVVPPALISVDTPPGAADHGGGATDLTFRALSEVKRAVRDKGLPHQEDGALPATSVAWLACIVDDQIAYHRLNHWKLERAEKGLHWLTNLLFLLIVVAIADEVAHTYLHCIPSYHWLPLLTAAGPAFAGALHGATTRLGMVHRADLSRGAQRDLKPIHDALVDLEGRPEMTDALWAKFRDLAFRAAEIMGRENTSWHGQVRLQRDSLPG